MDNPWNELSEAPWCLDQDKAAVYRHNAKASPDHRLRVQTTLPEPFIGNLRQATVIVLLANPGWAEADDQVHTDPGLREAILGCIREQPGKTRHYYLDDERADTPGGTWSRMKTRQLRETVGHDTVVDRLAIAEWLPYRSHRFKPLLVPSARYTHHLVAEAVKRDAWLVVRSRRQWEEAVPSMVGYRRAVSFKSQNASVSAGNLPDGVFESICEAMERAAVSN